MNTFSAQAAIRFGWETFKKRPGFFVGVTLIMALASWLMGAIVGAAGMGDDNIIGGVIQFVVSTIVDLGVVTVMLKSFDSVESASFSHMWNPSKILPYVGVAILVGIAAGIWFILVYALGPIGILIAIIPAIIAALLFIFAKYLVVDRNLGPIEAMQESFRITKPNLGTLFVFLIAVIVLNIVGALALLVGLLVTIPVSGLAMVYAYRTLGHKASEVVPAPAPAATPTM